MARRDDVEESEAYRWQDGVLTPLGKVPGATASYALAVSGDGSVVVGYDAFPDGSNVAFRWSDGQHVAIDVGPGGLVPDRAIGVSYDGSVIVGRQGWNTGTSEAFRWQSGVTSTLAAPGEQNQVSPFAHDVSDDGRIVVGSRAGGSWLWQDDTFISIDGFHATSLSADGNVVAGAIHVGPGIQNFEAALRTANGGVAFRSGPSRATARTAPAISRVPDRASSGRRARPRRMGSSLVHASDSSGMWTRGSAF